MRAFAGSAAPIGELAQRYVGRGMADVLEPRGHHQRDRRWAGLRVGRCADALRARRDRLLDQRLAVVSSTGAPAGGLAFVMTLDLAILVVFGVAKAKPIDVFFYFATIGTLSLLTMYVMTNVAATRFLAARGSRAGARAAAGRHRGGRSTCSTTTSTRCPDSPYDAFPYVVAGWLAVGVGFAAWRAPLSRRARGHRLVDRTRALRVAPEQHEGERGEDDHREQAGGDQRRGVGRRDDVQRRPTAVAATMKGSDVACISTATGTRSRGMTGR